MAATLLALFAAAPAGAAEPLRAGVGQADITPPTGFPLGGWTRADRTGQGQHTRLNARAMVLERGDRRVALVAADLFMAPGGLVKAAAERAGFSERNVLVSASHTHGGPGGFANFSTYNTTAPSTETIDDPATFAEFLEPKPADPQLYAFLVKRIAKAIRRADRDAAPAAAAWGSAKLRGVTRNRSVEAHLADHGITEEYAQGSAAQDPDGPGHTIDPAVNVLRVDKLVDGRRVPIGGWSTFANHGTVNPSEFEVYNQDHHGAATRGFEERVRRAGGVPRGQLVANVYGNSDEGDQSAGLGVRGPAHAERVGDREAGAMFEAWRQADARLTRRPALDLRWTRVCFCGQRTEGGRVASSPVFGLPFLTGSEEGRGPLFDITRVPLEGSRNPAEQPEQGHKFGITGATSESSVPKAVPLLAIQVDDGMIVSLPGEPTVEVGRRTRAAVLEATKLRPRDDDRPQFRHGEGPELGGSSGTRVRRVVISGLGNEYISYLTTPEEYDRQHYEGGSTIYGPLTSNLLEQELAELAGRLARGKPAQRAYPFDPENGVSADAEPYGDGAVAGRIETEPRRSYRRLDHPELSWRGGPRGLDRPLDDAFVIVERRDGGAWREAASDLGLEVLWSIEGGKDDDDRAATYDARWEVPRDAAPGRYRLRIEAKRYSLRSRAFGVRPSRALSPEVASSDRRRAVVTLDYPRAATEEDFTFRPPHASGGRIVYRSGGRERVAHGNGERFTLRGAPGETIVIPRGDARDSDGNRNGRSVEIQLDP